MSKNDITGDSIKTKMSNQEKYEEGFDRIWGKPKSVAFDVPLPPAGYTAEELERDNPYNQWMYEGEDK